MVNECKRSEVPAGLLLTSAAPRRLASARAGGTSVGRTAGRQDARRGFSGLPLVSDGRNRLCRLVLPVRALGILVHFHSRTSGRLSQLLGRRPNGVARAGDRRLRYRRSPAGRTNRRPNQRVAAVSLPSPLLDVGGSFWS